MDIRHVLVVRPIRRLGVLEDSVLLQKNAHRADQSFDPRILRRDAGTPVTPHTPSVHTNFAGIQFWDRFDEIDGGFAGTFVIVECDPVLASIAFALAGAVNS